MGHVYAATHRNGMRGAVKVMHVDPTADAIVLRRFLREGYVANRVQHPGAVKVIDDDVTEDGAPFLVMELLEGETLKERTVRRGTPLSAEEVVDAGIEILGVLAVAHAAGVIHRDVKPANVLMTADGRLKLLDFGIARVREREARLDATRTGSMLGTPAYMAPEQALARWDRVDHRSDLFSVGATLWTLLTGVQIHEAETLPELLIAHSTARVRPLRQVFPSALPALAAVIDRALQFEPPARWQDARAMQQALLGVRDEMRGHRGVSYETSFIGDSTSVVLGSHTLAASDAGAGGSAPRRSSRIKLVAGAAAVALIASAVTAAVATSATFVGSGGASRSALPEVEPSPEPTVAPAPASVAAEPPAPEVVAQEIAPPAPSSSSSGAASATALPARPQTSLPRPRGTAAAPATAASSPTAAPAATPARPKFDE
jgi:serine/threonine-protein kinase